MAVIGKSQFYYGTGAQYNALKAAGELDSLGLYMIEGGKIYRGAENFNEVVVRTFAEDLPAVGEQGKVYILFNAGNTEATQYVYNGSSFIPISESKVNDLTSYAQGQSNYASGSNVIPTVKGVVDFVDKKVQDIVAGDVTDLIEGAVEDVIESELYLDKSQDITKFVTNVSAACYAGQVKVDNGTGSSTNVTVPLVVTGISLVPNDSGAAADEDTLIFTRTTGSDIKINIKKEQFIQSVQLVDTDLVFTFVDGSTIEVNVNEFLGLISVQDSSTIDLEMDNNVITADVKVSSASNNIVTINSDGIFVEDKSLNKISKVGTAVAGRIVTFLASGEVQDSGKSFLSGTIADDAAANTIADSAQVKSYVDVKVTELDDTLQNLPSYGITNEQIVNWTTAYANTHTHSNQAVLNNITLTKTENWDAAYNAVNWMTIPDPV